MLYIYDATLNRKEKMHKKKRQHFSVCKAKKFCFVFLAELLPDIHSTYTAAPPRCTLRIRYVYTTHPATKRKSLYAQYNTTTTNTYVCVNLCKQSVRYFKVAARS